MKKDERDKLTLRLAPELRVRLVACAAENNRSLNAEITQRLRASFQSYRKL